MTATTPPPAGSRVVNFRIHAHGVSGMLFDAVSIIHAVFFTNTLLLLGAQGLPVALVIRLLFKRDLRIIVNPGGVEWERPKFNALARWFLRYVYQLGARKADFFVLDNEHYLEFLPESIRSSDISPVRVVPYGGDIDQSACVSKVKEALGVRFDRYYLSVSRALEDNCIYELCDAFVKAPSANLVLVSNLSSSEYGERVRRRFGDVPNIKLIDSLYVKSELDAIRRGCHAYVHTHTLCGSAPSLIEMIVCGKPIISIDVPQNRFTLKGQGLFFRSYDELGRIVSDGQRPDTPDEELRAGYSWDSIIRLYCGLLDDRSGRRGG
jgi:glycosyltransferase involved in cell wall biosynthesis